MGYIINEKYAPIDVDECVSAYKQKRAIGSQIRNHDVCGVVTISIIIVIEIPTISIIFSLVIVKQRKIERQPFANNKEYETSQQFPLDPTPQIAIVFFNLIELPIN